MRAIQMRLVCVIEITNTLVEFNKSHLNPDFTIFTSNPVFAGNLASRCHMRVITGTISLQHLAILCTNNMTSHPILP